MLMTIQGSAMSLVNESGASVYSASELARHEFPELTVEKRSAISIARRLPKTIGRVVIDARVDRCGCTSTMSIRKN